MPDCFIWGKKGSGKTLEAVKRLWLKWLEGNEIWTNLELHPLFDYNIMTRQRGNYHKIDVMDLIQLMIEGKIPDTKTPKVLLLDEIKTQASSRTFHTFINRQLVNFVSQSRKRNFSLIYTDQILIAYDKWIRDMTDKIIRCIPHNDLNDLGLGTKDYPEPIYFEYIEGTVDPDAPNYISDIKRYIRTRETARLFYPCYKTSQMITPAEMKYGNNTNTE